MKSRLWLALPGFSAACVVLLFAIPSAALGAEPSAAVPAYNQFTADDEIRIGAAMAHDFEASREILTNALLDKYLTDTVTRLGKASRRPELTFTCKALNSRDINAFSLPGGAIYVTTGLLAYVQDESELASVMAHEIGHVAGRHLLNRMALQLKSKSLWDQARRMMPLLDDKQVLDGFQKIGLPVLNVASVQFDRSNESEADLFGVYNMLRANWSPLGAVRALDRLKDPGEAISLLAGMMNSHPNPGDRSRALSAEIKTMALSGSLDDNSLSFRAMKLGLDLLPKPKGSGK
jgi:beta-barrel assembly-enhancing protease